MERLMQHIGSYPMKGVAIPSPLSWQVNLPTISKYAMVSWHHILLWTIFKLERVDSADVWMSLKLSQAWLSDRIGIFLNFCSFLITLDERRQLLLFVFDCTNPCLWRSAVHSVPKVFPIRDPSVFMVPSVLPGMLLSFQSSLFLRFTKKARVKTYIESFSTVFAMLEWPTPVRPSLHWLALINLHEDFLASDIKYICRDSSPRSVALKVPVVYRQASFCRNCQFVRI